MEHKMLTTVEHKMVSIVVYKMLTVVQQKMMTIVKEDILTIGSEHKDLCVWAQIMNKNSKCEDNETERHKLCAMKK